MSDFGEGGSPGFRIKPGNEPFTKADFEESPAWSEHYDHEDIDLIASWGIARSWVAEQFRMMDDGGAHPVFTILDQERLPHQNLRIFLKAVFRHPSGLLLDGYVMNAGAECIGLFGDGREFVFSAHPRLKEEMLPSKRDAEAEFGVAELFPLIYQTGFLDSCGIPIQCEFSLG